jgi:hypothetical protein
LLFLSLLEHKLKVFGRGACQSSSFWWPVAIDFDAETWYSEFEFLNTTLATGSTDRPPQSILIDVGEEPGSKMEMLGAARAVYEKLGSMEHFHPEENLWVHAYPGQPHSPVAFIGRVWSVLSILSSGRAYP